MAPLGLPIVSSPLGLLDSQSQSFEKFEWPRSPAVGKNRTYLREGAGERCPPWTKGLADGKMPARDERPGNEQQMEGATEALLPLLLCS